MAAPDFSSWEILVRRSLAGFWIGGNLVKDWTARTSTEPPVPPEESKSMTAPTWISIVVLALFSLFWEYVFGFCCLFSPGWANDPLFGPDFHTVLATVMTAWIALLLMTAAAGVGAIVGFLCGVLGVGKRYGLPAFRIWLWFAAVTIV
jgi:hypothetical protein